MHNGDGSINAAGRGEDEVEDEAYPSDEWEPEEVSHTSVWWLQFADLLLLIAMLLRWRWLDRVPDAGFRRGVERSSDASCK